MMVLPDRLIVWAPAGGWTEEDGPTASTLPSRTIRVAFSIAALPEPSKRRAPTKAFTRAVLPDWPAPVAKPSASGPTTKGTHFQAWIFIVLLRHRITLPSSAEFVAAERTIILTL